MKAYEAYKDSGVQWMGFIPRHWSRARLKYCCSKITDGSHYSPPTVEKGKRYVSVKDVGDSQIDFENCKQITLEEFDTLIRNGCQPLKGDILLTKDGTIGRAIIVQEDNDFVVLSSLGILRPIGSKMNSIFLRYYLTSRLNIDQMLSVIQGSALTRITITIIKNLLNVVPPFEEQIIIGNYLDHKTSQLDTLISKKEKLIELLQEERTAIVNQAVTKGLDPNVPMKDSGIEWLGEIPEHWEMKKIAYVCKVVRGASPRPAGDPLLFNGSYMPWITVKEVTNAVGKFILSTETFLTEEGSKQTRILEPETLILSNSGATLGVPRITLIKGAINDGSVAFLNLKIERDYLYYFFATHTKIYRDEVSGYGQPNLNTEIVKSTCIPIPEMDEQREIVRYIELQLTRLENISLKILQEIELLKEYKTALISEVVTGKVDVRNELLSRH